MFLSWEAKLLVPPRLMSQPSAAAAAAATTAVILLFFFLGNATIASEMIDCMPSAKDRSIDHTGLESPVYLSDLTKLCALREHRLCPLSR